ncbi:MAG TPA: TM2 domain-containing protein [Intrasporangium sp.]|uniref:TM2 domain-containing protein n=1 Tax=Intrasporangium sp. TaxID=1925024 RepID=UPI002D7935E3|nr:TM2 domain-containing protein [Intrasporangium sp.]HET7397859.1 TM2 domain-containing protein [Intrasporangium sp.]
MVGSVVGVARAPPQPRGRRPLPPRSLGINWRINWRLVSSEQHHLPVDLPVDAGHGGVRSLRPGPEWYAGRPPIASRGRPALRVLGVLGVHRFDVGKAGTGVLQLLTAGGLGIWWLVDFILIVVGSFRGTRRSDSSSTGSRPASSTLGCAPPRPGGADWPAPRHTGRAHRRPLVPSDGSPRAHRPRRWRTNGRR